MDSTKLKLPAAGLAIALSSFALGTQVAKPESAKQAAPSKDPRKYRASCKAAPDSDFCRKAGDQK